MVSTSPAERETSPPSAPRPALTQVNVVVSDMERSVAFYRLLGLHDEPMPPEWHPHHRRLTGGGSGIPDFELDSEAFAGEWAEGLGSSTGSGSGRTVLGFQVPTRHDVDQLYSRLVAAGHRSQQSPYDAFWGARYAVVEDPDGNPVGLTSPIDPTMRRPAEPPS